MQKLSLKKRMDIARLYFGGLPYDEIAARVGVSKGAVAGVIAELKAGQFPEFKGLTEQVEVLREVAADLRRLRLTPGEAVAGLAALSEFRELGVEPGDVPRWAAMCRELAPQETGAQAFVQAALALRQVHERSGLGFEALGDKVQWLEEEVTRLEPLAQELQGCEQQLEQTTVRRESLTDEVALLEKRRRLLGQDIVHKEEREVELSQRNRDLEERAAAADERLVAARRELQTLTELGLSLEDVPGFVQRLSGIAQRHGIQPGTLRERLLHELEEFDQCLGLEALVETRRMELATTEQAIAKEPEKLAAMKAAVQKLRQEQAALQATLSKEKDYLRGEIGAFTRIAKEGAAELRQNLGIGVSEAVLEVQRLRDQALELGQQIGRCEGILESNRWLQSLMALANGEDGVAPGQVRAIGLTVLRGIVAWLERHSSGSTLFPYLGMKMGEVVKEMNQWEV